MPYFPPYTAFKNEDIGGLSENLVDVIINGIVTSGLATEATLLNVYATLQATSDGESVADLLEEIVNSGSAYGNKANFVNGDSGAMTTNAAFDVIAAPGASNFIFITSVLVTNSHASVGTLVSLRDEDGTAIPGATGYAAPGGGGFTLTLTTPIKMPTANKKLQAICGTTGANVYVSIVGYKGL